MTGSDLEESISNLIQRCWQALTPTRKETSYSDRRFWCSYILLS